MSAQMNEGACVDGAESDIGCWYGTRLYVAQKDDSVIGINPVTFWCNGPRGIGAHRPNGLAQALRCPVRAVRQGLVGVFEAVACITRLTPAGSHFGMKAPLAQESTSSKSQRMILAIDIFRFDEEANWMNASQTRI